MGLDSYLYAEKYLSNHSFVKAKEKRAYAQLLKAVGLTKKDTDADHPHSFTKFAVAYWRKAYAVHQWFVDIVQDGDEEKDNRIVSREQIQELVQGCKEIIAAHKENPKEGFFNLSSEDGEHDEYYFEMLQDTINQLEKVLKNPKFKDWDFRYEASW